MHTLAIAAPPVSRRAVFGIGFARVARVPIPVCSIAIRSITFCSIAVCLIAATATAIEPLSTTASIRRLTVAEANQARPVELRGVVTFRDDSRYMLFVQDETGGVYVHTTDNPATHRGPPSVRPGVEVRLHGVTDPGGFSPCVAPEPSFEVIGPTEMPTPLYPRRGDLLDPKFDSQWVEIDSTVTSIETQDAALRLKLAINGSLYDAYVSGDWSEENYPRHWLMSDVSIRGVYGSKFNARRQLEGMQLFVPDRKWVRVMDSGMQRAFATVPRSVNSLMSFQQDGERARLQGVVTAQWQANEFYIRGDGGSALIRTIEPVGLDVGREVDLAGYPMAGSIRPSLVDTVVRIGSISTEPVPKELRDSQVDSGQWQGELVRVEGRVLDYFRRPFESILVLEMPRGRIYVEIPSGSPHIARDSWVTVTGICQLERLLTRWDSSAGIARNVSEISAVDHEMSPRTSTRQRWNLVATAHEEPTDMDPARSESMLRSDEASLDGLSGEAGSGEDRSNFSSDEPSVPNREDDGFGLTADPVGEMFSVRLITRGDDDIRILRSPSWWTPNRLTNLALFLVAGLAIVAGWVLMLRRKLREQTQLLESKIERQKVADERSRIARELHDTLEQELVGISMQLDTASSRMQNDPEKAKRSLELARQMIRHSRDETRRNVWELRSPSVNRQTLSTEIDSMIQRMQTADGPKITFQIDDGLPQMAGSEANQIYRVVQEAITNAIKHAQASRIQIHIGPDDEGWALQVQDDGVGFEVGRQPSPNEGHFGIAGMRERAQKLASRLDVRSRIGEGTVIRLRLPIESNLVGSVRA